MGPGSLIADRHNIGMTGEGKMRPVGADAGKQIVDAFVTLAKGKPRAGKPHTCKLALQQVERTAFMRRH